MVEITRQQSNVLLMDLTKLFIEKSECYKDFEREDSLLNCVLCYCNNLLAGGDIIFSIPGLEEVYYELCNYAWSGKRNKTDEELKKILLDKNMHLDIYEEIQSNHFMEHTWSPDVARILIYFVMELFREEFKKIAEGINA